MISLDISNDTAKRINTAQIHWTGWAVPESTEQDCEVMLCPFYKFLVLDCEQRTGKDNCHDHLQGGSRELSPGSLILAPGNMTEYMLLEAIFKCMKKVAWNSQHGLTMGTSTILIVKKFPTPN